MCARCMLIWQIEELEETLEELGKKLGCWFYVDTTEDLMVLWKAYKDVGNDSIEILCNGDTGCTVSQFEEDVKNMPNAIKAALSVL
ncbi:MAG: hypothetical protein MJ050_05030 [Phascolarctobacterium sp.]|nr:hypothetical protein [Phascolarctobacterium sp.]